MLNYGTLQRNSYQGITGNLKRTRRWRSWKVSQHDIHLSNSFLTLITFPKKRSREKTQGRSKKKREMESAWKQKDREIKKKKFMYSVAERNYI